MSTGDSSETLLVVARRHPLVLLPRLTSALGVVGAALAVLIGEPSWPLWTREAVGILLALGVLGAALATIGWWRRAVMLTTTRLFVRRSGFSRHGEQVALVDVAEVVVQRRLASAAIGLGRLLVRIRGGEELTTDALWRPGRVTAALRSVPLASPGAVVSPTDGPGDSHLEALRGRGIITTAELEEVRSRGRAH